MNWPEVKAWRKASRTMLIAARRATPVSSRTQWAKEIAARLEPVLIKAAAPISFYWPFKAEPDLRPLMRELDSRGVTVALPVAIRLGEPMTFRPWTDGAPMTRGIWNIPIPATSETVVPKTVIAPIVGFDARNYRLGYGGGFFDRTLEKLGAAMAIGVGFSMFRLRTIHPQAHDIAMADIVTEATSSPPCYADTAETGYTRPLSDTDLAREVWSIAAAVPPERLPLLEFVVWQLTNSSERRNAKVTRHTNPAEYLSRFLPRIRDDGVYAAVRVLRDSLRG